MTNWCVYGAYSPEAELLYIGHTGDLRARLRVHRRDRRWWDEVEYVFSEPVADKTTAMCVERAAIKAERPKYNMPVPRWR